MRLTRRAALLGAAFALTSVFTLAACSDDEPGQVDLTGSYEVIAVAFPAAGAAPDFNDATGTAELTSDEYTVNIDLVGTSEGTYIALDDGTFTQDGTTTPVGQAPIATQCVGTWDIDNDGILTTDTTCLGQRSVVQLAPLS
jgi:hypothetical protein